MFAVRDTSPNGQPVMARICCSNWHVMAASIVQWPELCGRGAISLISKESSSKINNSSPNIPTKSSALARFIAIFWALLATFSGILAGRVDFFKIPDSWKFSAGS